MSSLQGRTRTRSITDHLSFDGPIEKRQTSTRSFRVLGIVLYGLVGFQSFHMAEHGMLYLQYYVEGLAKPTAILEALFNDTIVQVHFVFNLILYAFLLVSLILYVKAKGMLTVGSLSTRNVLFFQLALYGLVLFQSVHMFDHVLQYFQFYVLGVSSPKGIFGQFIDDTNIAIHLVVNGLLYEGLIVAALFYVRIRRAIQVV